MLRLELNDLLEGGFELALTGISEDELSKLSVGVGVLEAMPDLLDRDRSPFRDMTFIVRRAIRYRRARDCQADQTARSDQSKPIATRQRARRYLRRISRASIHKSRLIGAAYPMFRYARSTAK
ncbi:hypothetical protein [Bradyrhizobium japonicum]|uniref:hypothetical protein n=1 Tax=Bradyrhizobium japonicum TaxID=375 RepID=UPI000B18019B|nr:hypothetical protein [Bradyrhizobium japonicum]